MLNMETRLDKKLLNVLIAVGSTLLIIMLNVALLKTLFPSMQFPSFQKEFLPDQYVLFAWVHGSTTNILIQGVGGFFFGWVYIKNGYSYWSAILAHALYNFTVMLIIPVLINL
jgi:hypothetical protein